MDRGQRGGRGRGGGHQESYGGGRGGGGYRGGGGGGRPRGSPYPGGRNAVSYEAADRQWKAQPQKKQTDVEKVSTELAAVDLSKKQIDARPPRRGEGLAGFAIQLRANLFRMTWKGVLQLQKYAVSITIEGAEDPSRMGRNRRRQLFWRALDTLNLPNVYRYYYDGDQICYALESMAVAQKFKDKDGSGIKVELVEASGRTVRKIYVTLSETTPVSVDLKRLVELNFGMIDTEPMQILDIILRSKNTHPPYWEEFLVATRSCVYRLPQERERVDLSRGRELWHGYYTAAHVLSGNQAYLNLDTTASAFYKKQPLLGFVGDVLRGFPVNPRERATYRFRQMEIMQLKRALKGVQLEVTHQNGNGKSDKKSGTKQQGGAVASAVLVLNGEGKTYKVKTIMAKNANEATFQERTEDGEERTTTVAEYFARKYHRRLEYPLLNLLDVGSANKVTYMPMEVCLIKAGQRFRGKLDEDATSQMIKAVSIFAPERKQRIERELNHSAAYATDPFVQESGITIDKDFAKCKGRVIPPPKIQFGNNVIVDPIDGVFEHRNQKLLDPVKIDSWAIISFTNQRAVDNIQHFAQQLVREAADKGIAMADLGGLIHFARDHSEKSVEAAINWCIQKTGRSVQLIVVIMPGKDIDRYSQVKRQAETKLGVMTQCFQERNMMKGDAIGNLLLKINQKLGGRNWALASTDYLTKLVFTNDKVPTIFIGIDVSHPSPAERLQQQIEVVKAAKEKRPARHFARSVATIVGSSNLPADRYQAYHLVQPVGRENVVDLTLYTHDLVLQFFRMTGKKPGRIVVYRDGVSEGQFREVLNEELRSIMAGCAKIEKGFRPELAYLVCLKRHHVRLFPESSADACGRAGNVPPGTVVDTDIVHPRGDDFYLCSHFGIQGTSRPTHYNVLFNTTTLTPDDLQGVTYYLTHLFERSSRAISIPAPVALADLLCLRIRYYLHGMLYEDEDSSDGGGVAQGPRRDVTDADLAAATKLMPKFTECTPRGRHYTMFFV